MPSTASPAALPRTTTVMQIATLLTDRIVRGELGPGTPLREASLANALGVSRNTLREGIQVLVHAGLARHYPHRGATVASLTAADVRDLFAMRRLVELAAVRVPGTLRDEIDQAMTGAIRALEHAVQDRRWADVIECDLRFHRALVDRLESPRLGQFYDTVLRELRLGLIFVDLANDTVSALARKHRKIHRLLARGNRRECRVAVERHLAESEKKMLLALRAPDEGKKRRRPGVASTYSQSPTKSRRAPGARLIQ